MRTEEILLVVPKTHRLAGSAHVPLSEVAHEAVVIEKVGSGLRDAMETYCQQAGFTLRPAYEIDEPAALFTFVNVQLGVGFTTGLMEKQVHEHGLTSLHLTLPCAGYIGHPFRKEALRERFHLLSLLATVGRQGYNQGSRQDMFMLEQRQPNFMKEKLLLWIVFFPISCSSDVTA